MARAYRIRHPKKRAFLAEYSQCGNVSRAARAAGVCRTTIYDWLERDEKFSMAMKLAEAEATEVLEEEARRRAVDGTAKPVYQGGQLVGHVQEYSDTLLIFLLKGLKPEKYRERYDVKHGGSVGVGSGDSLSDEERESVRRALTGRGGDS